MTFPSADQSQGRKYDTHRGKETLPSVSVYPAASCLGRSSHSWSLDGSLSAWTPVLRHPRHASQFRLIRGVRSRSPTHEAREMSQSPAPSAAGRIQDGGSGKIDEP